MSKQLKSILLSTAIFAAFVAEHLILPPESDPMLAWVAYLIPAGLFLLFWMLRSVMNYKGHWHYSGTVWIVWLMIMFSAWGIFRFFVIDGNKPLSVLNEPATQLALYGTEMALAFLAIEIGIAFFSKLMRRKKANNSLRIADIVRLCALITINVVCLCAYRVIAIVTNGNLLLAKILVAIVMAVLAGLLLPTLKIWLASLPLQFISYTAIMGLAYFLASFWGFVFVRMLSLPECVLLSVAALLVQLIGVLVRFFICKYRTHKQAPATAK